MASISVLDGGPLPDPTVSSLADCLIRAAGAGHGTGVHYVTGNGDAIPQTYAELLDQAARVLGGIRSAGLPAGTKVLLQSADQADLLAGFWACVLGGYVPVPVSAHPPAGSERTAAQLLDDAWANMTDAQVLTGGDGWRGPGWLGDISRLRAGRPDQDWRFGSGPDLAVLLLTSGSTGRQKAVMLSHCNILSRCAATVEVRGLTSADRSFNWMPLDHVGGLVMIHIRDVFVGCDQLHAPTRWVLEDPLRWLEVADRHQVTTTWAPNFAYGLVNDHADRIASHDWDLSRLRYVMNGGEAVKPQVVRRFVKLLGRHGLPYDAIHPGWGMSETSSGVVDCRFDPDGPDDRFVSVGRPHPGARVRLVDDEDRPVPTGDIGHVQVCGAPVTIGYHHNPAQNQRSFTADGWFRTGDLGFIENDGLTVTGRADEVIMLGDIERHADEIEAAVEELDFVEPSYTVCCLVDGELAVFYHLRGRVSEDVAQRRILDLLGERFGVAAARILPVARDRIPKTGIGKLKRARLHDLLASGIPEFVAMRRKSEGLQ
ncbi:AMP-binding protein [Frankia gtarii]|uniref:AMP-binding protein n=1 Tax=Frankia gtarii TaxID=2950102 RepID=UPI0021C140CB|nr:AMP-binding protein [Frankia gtarii]